jgi:hypothetical protein
VPFRSGKIRSQGGVEADGHQPILADGDLTQVPATSLDAYIASTRLVPQLIKIDVEGGEAEVLRGGELLFANERPLIIAEIHTIEARDAVRSWMYDHAYTGTEMILHDPAPIRLLAWPKEQDPGPWRG